MIRVQDIKLSLDEDATQLIAKIAKKLRIKPDEITSYTVFKEAVDARKKEEIKLVYTVDIQTLKEAEVLAKFPQLKAPDKTYYMPQKGNMLLTNRPVIVGSGPCGLFAALILAQAGFRPIVLERGKSVEKRVEDVDLFWKTGKLDPSSNVQFGEGGAGTFSDGKLTTQIKNIRSHKVLEELVQAGAPSQILYKNKPHVGTDILREVVKNLRHTIISLGGEVRFESQVTQMVLKDGHITGVEINHKDYLSTDICVLAIGHSARDTFEMLYKSDMKMEQKSFAMGMRIEHLQDWINEAQYGRFKDHPKLGAADYKLVHHAKNGRTVYSFCMCPGGYVIASASEEGMVVTNGMSHYKRNAQNANSAILVNVGPKDYPSDHPLAGMMLQRDFEKLAYEMGDNTYYAPAQLVGDFLNNQASHTLGTVKPTYTPGIKLTNMREKLPNFMAEAIDEAIRAFGGKIKGFDHNEALFTGFETRTSSPVRLLRDPMYQSNITGVYPAGEGAGYAGGIISAAVDGIEVAEAIIKVYGGIQVNV
ncbi:NAD(P)/FAD-dependent oxidoreductase [Cellulosilyticum sp. I15G10I2]|uniref:NAD(P)/FAD-dependent oxidoreductase n=1 Tax=Cellulosilyticum sp. I15G10I2 TaxID=1892843 RepID=UPI00085BB3D0|nr:FAD-dependent monooxygenase [Cellulosilyticum sp. I15G10I2]